VYLTENGGYGSVVMESKAGVMVFNFCFIPIPLLLNQYFSRFTSKAGVMLKIPESR
jgi:hypothetical protein